MGEIMRTDNDLITKTAAFGFGAGSACGAVVANLYDIPKVDMNVSHPGLIRTLKGCGSYGFAFAAIGGIYVCVEQYMLEKRKKKDFVNAAAAAFLT